jgi:hypothetical protein
MLCFFLISVGLIFPVALHAEAPGAAAPLENEIAKILGGNIKCNKITVQIRLSKEKPDEIKTLAVKLENAALGGMTADYVTVLYEKPVIDMTLLRKAKKFKIISSSGSKAGILISANAIEKYIAARIKQYQKKPVRVSIRFSPPYAECFFNGPVSEIDPKILKLLGKYMKGKNMEGYAAIQMKAKDNALSAVPSKLIINHFLIPDTVCQELQNMIKTIDRVPVLPLLRYSINNVTVQKNYLFLTN